MRPPQSDSFFGRDVASTASCFYRVAFGDLFLLRRDVAAAKQFLIVWSLRCRAEGIVSIGLRCGRRRVFHDGLVRMRSRRSHSLLSCCDAVANTICYSFLSMLLSQCDLSSWRRDVGSGQQFVIIGSLGSRHSAIRVQFEEMWAPCSDPSLFCRSGSATFAFADVCLSRGRHRAIRYTGVAMWQPQSESLFLLSLRFAQQCDSVRMCRDVVATERFAAIARCGDHTAIR